MEFGKRHDTTDTTDFCPRQLVTDLLRTCDGETGVMGFTLRLPHSEILVFRQYYIVLRPVQQETALLQVRIGNDLVVVLVPPGSTTSALTSIPRLWTLYTRLKIDQRGELSQRPQGYAIYDDSEISVSNQVGLIL